MFYVINSAGSSARDPAWTRFPVQKNAEYLAIIKQKRSPWPLNEAELASTIQKLKDDNQYQVLSESDDLIVLKKL